MTHKRNGEQAAWEKVRQSLTDSSIKRRIWSHATARTHTQQVPAELWYITVTQSTVKRHLLTYSAGALSYNCWQNTVRVCVPVTRWGGGGGNGDGPLLL